MSEHEEVDLRSWDAGWEAHTIAQRRRMAKLSLAEKLQWLEEAHALARRLQSQRQPDRPQEDRDP